MTKNELLYSGSDLSQLKGNTAPKKVVCFIILIESLSHDYIFGEKSKSFALSVLEILAF